MTGKGPESRVHGSPPQCSPSPIQPATQMQAFRALSHFTLFQPSSVSIWARQICSPVPTRACKIHVAPQHLHKPRYIVPAVHCPECFLSCTKLLKICFPEKPLVAVCSASCLKLLHVSVFYMDCCADTH